MQGGQITARFAITGQSEARQSLRDVRDEATGLGAAMESAFSRASDQVNRALERQRILAEQLRQTPVQATISGAVDERGGKSARDSASAMAALFAEQERLQRSADALRAAVDPLWAAERRFADETARADALLARGAISVETHAKAIALSKKDFDEAAAAARRLGAAGENAGVQLNRMQLMEFAHSGRAMLDMLIAGQSPLQALAMEGPRLAQALGEGQGGVAGAMRMVGAFVNPVTVGIAALAGAMIAGGIATIQYAHDLEELQKALAGEGRVTGATITQINAIAEAQSKAGTTSSGALRKVETTLVGVGRVYAENLSAATAVTVMFSKAMREQLPDAAKELAKSFSDPAKGAEELSSKYGLLSAAQAEHIKQLQLINGLAAAQSQLAKDLKGSLDGVREHVEGLAAAWQKVWGWANNAWDAMGKALARDAGIRDPHDDVKMLQQKISVIPAGPAGDTLRRSLQAQLAVAQQEAAKDDAKQAEISRKAQINAEAGAKRALIDGGRPTEARIAGLEDDKAALRAMLNASNSAELLKAAGRTREEVENSIAGYDKQIADARRREGADARREAAAENAAAGIRRQVESQVAQADQQRVQAVQRSAHAGAEIATMGIAAAAMMYARSETEREQHIQRAALDAQITNAFDRTLELQLQSIDRQEAKALQEIEDQTKWSAAQKAAAAAAARSAAAAERKAAADEDGLKRGQENLAAMTARENLVRQALAATASNKGASAGERLAAGLELSQRERQSQLEALDAVLSKSGVEEATRNQALLALGILQKMKPQADVENRLAELKQQQLHAAAGLATTTADRAKAEQALLEIAQQERRHQAEVLLAQLKAGDPRIERTRTALSSLEAYEQEAARRAAMLPLQRQGFDIRSRDPREQADQFLAQHLGGLSEALTNAAMSSRNFNKAIADVISGVEHDAIKGVLDRVIVAPLSNYLSGLLDSVFGPKKMADAAQAGATTTLTANTSVLTAGFVELSRVVDLAAAALMNMASASGAKSAEDFSSLIGTGGFGLPAHAKGINFSPSGRAIVGEEGPEVVDLPYGSRVWPNGKTPPPRIDSSAGPSNGGGGGNVIIHDHRTKSEPLPRARRSPNGDTIIDIGAVGRQMIRNSPEDVRDSLMAAPPKVTRRA